MCLLILNKRFYIIVCNTAMVLKEKAQKTSKWQKVWRKFSVSWVPKPWVHCPWKETFRPPNRLKRFGRGFGFWGRSQDSRPASTSALKPNGADANHHWHLGFCKLARAGVKCGRTSPTLGAAARQEKSNTRVAPCCGSCGHSSQEKLASTDSAVACRPTLIPKMPFLEDIQ